MEAQVTITVLLKIGIIITCIGVLSLAVGMVMMDKLRCPKCSAVLHDNQCRRCGFGMPIGRQ